MTKPGLSIILSPVSSSDIMMQGISVYWVWVPGTELPGPLELPE